MGEQPTDVAPTGLSELAPFTQDSTLKHFRLRVVIRQRDGSKQSHVRDPIFDAGWAARALRVERVDLLHADQIQVLDVRDMSEPVVPWDCFHGWDAAEERGAGDSAYASGAGDGCDFKVCVIAEADEAAARGGG